MQEADAPGTVCAQGAAHDKTINTAQLVAVYRDPFGDKALTLSKGGRAFSRTLAHGAFYAGASNTLQVLAYMLERGDIEQLHRTIASQGRQIRVITGLAPRKRRH